MTPSQRHYAKLQRHYENLTTNRNSAVKAYNNALSKLQGLNNLDASYQSNPQIQAAKISLLESVSLNANTILMAENYILEFLKNSGAEKAFIKKQLKAVKEAKSLFESHRVIQAV